METVDPEQPTPEGASSGGLSLFKHAFFVSKPSSEQSKKISISFVFEDNVVLVSFEAVQVGFGIQKAR